MSFYDIEEEPFVKRITSIKEELLKTDKVVLLKFLNTREQELVKFVIGKSLYLYFSSITEYDEHKRCVISSFEIEPDFKISILKINYNKKYLSLNHRVVLGNIMALQIERNMIGDILIDENKDCYITCAKEIKDVILSDLRRINHTEIELSELDDLNIDYLPNLEIKKHFVSSLRLDLILSSGFSISRREALDMIEHKKCKLNQRVMLRGIVDVKENDIISLEHYGRIKVVSIKGLSKSGKIMVEIGEFK